MSWAVEWIDRDSAPVIEETDSPVDGEEVFATFTEARDDALQVAVSARERAAEVVREIRAMRKPLSNVAVDQPAAEATG